MKGRAFQWVLNAILILGVLGWIITSIRYWVVTNETIEATEYLQQQAQELQKINQRYQEAVNRLEALE